MYCVHLYGLHVYCAFVVLDSCGPPGVRPTPGLTSSTQVVCVCMHVYIFICMMPLHVYAYVHGCIYVYVYVHVFVCICICICTCVYTCMYLYITCMCSLFHLALGNEDGGVQLVYESACCLA